MKVAIYARCSTNENRQNVELQLRELRRYCDAYEWEYKEVAEYGSGFKEDSQPKLKQIIESLRTKNFDCLIVYSLDRFSRQSPSKINALLDTIVEKYKCRFIALQQGIDSENELTWHTVKPLFTYFANKYSKDLGEKIKKGIALKKEKGTYAGGASVKSVNSYQIKLLKSAGLSLRDIAKKMNKDLLKKDRISYSTVYRRLKNTVSETT